MVLSILSHKPTKSESSKKATLSYKSIALETTFCRKDPRVREVGKYEYRILAPSTWDEALVIDRKDKGNKIMVLISDQESLEIYRRCANLKRWRTNAKVRSKMDMRKSKPIKPSQMLNWERAARDEKRRSDQMGQTVQRIAGYQIATEDGRNNPSFPKIASYTSNRHCHVSSTSTNNHRMGQMENTRKTKSN